MTRSKSVGSFEKRLLAAGSSKLAKYAPTVEAYRSARFAGAGDLPAWERAVSVYREQHPDLADDELRSAVGSLIAEATQTDPIAFWQ